MIITVKEFWDILGSYPIELRYYDRETGKDGTIEYPKAREMDNFISKNGERQIREVSISDFDPDPGFLIVIEI